MNRYTIDNPMDLSIESDDGEFVFYDEAQAEIDALKQQNAELLAVAQNVVDAHASTTHAIIAPNSEAFARAVLDRQKQRDAAIYQLRQAIAKARGDL